MKAISIIFSAVTRAFSRQINRYIRVFQNLNKIRSKLYTYINSFVRDLFNKNIKKPGSKGDYLKLGSRYYAKSILILSCAAVIILFFVFSFYILPWAEGRLWTPTIVLNTPKFHTYSGKAKVVNSDGILIYRGQLNDGRITGTGQQFDNSGHMIYSGAFEMENYEGQGELYDKNGGLKYKGTFKKGRYEGKGILYNNGNMTYEGNFSNGVYEGSGVLYDDKGEIVYKGNFLGGDYSGVGVLYYSNGREKYAGSFLLNEFQGEGKYYSDNGVLTYEGNFSNGKYEGKGMLYSPDTKTIIYDGEFANGLFQGNGKLYAAENRRLLYEGSFEAGKYNGLGKLYDSKNGKLLYTGNFYDGEVDYVYFLNQKASIVRQAFGDEDDLTYFDDCFEIMYKDIKVTFVCNYSADDSDPLIDKIIFAGNQKIYGTESGMRKSALEKSFDDIFTIAEYDIDEIRKTHMNYFELNTDENAGEAMYGVKFLKDKIYLRYYFYNNKDEVVFYEIGETY